MALWCTGINDLLPVLMGVPSLPKLKQLACLDF
jgi:hypothetical protein